MADVNKVILIGRLTRDPEMRTFSNGGKVAKFGFAVGSRRKNLQTGQWEDGDTMFIDCEAFNKGDFGHLADRVEQYLRKGNQVFLEGRLKLESWDDKTTGQKRSKHALVIENMQFLEPRGGGSGDGGEGGGYSRPARTGGQPAAQKPAAYTGEDDYGGGGPDAGGGGGANDTEIPF
jgi:single-strand DNA-binding protein